MAKEISGYVKLQCRAAKPIRARQSDLHWFKGVNIMEFCKQFNARTQDKMGKVLPVLLTVYADKSFDFVIKTPPAARAADGNRQVQEGFEGIQPPKGGKVTWEQSRRDCQGQDGRPHCFKLESAAKMVAGTARLWA
jgi:large subunit ribosomal protein L11